jgi:DNA-binding NtrC family response regulator
MTTFAQILTDSPELQAVLRAAQVVAAADVNVLILGESGTGKELLARALHQASRRATRPFVALNCAALPENLAESLLFGHSRGAFSGATQDHIGQIQAADGGTLLLDEVGELPLALQAKLLRFLESGEYHPVGQTSARHANVRVLAATHRDLAAMVRDGSFRADLYYRLHVVPLELPALRARRGDIALLLAHFTAQLSAQHELPAPHYSTAALTRLRDHAWPGNVRELRNFCERMLILCSGRNIEPANLPQEIRAPHAAVDSSTLPFRFPEQGLQLEDLEQSLIRQALHSARGNRSRAARLLGLTRDTLLYRIKKYAIVA